ncbi:MAG: ADP-ribosylation factor-like protein [Candidatus Odinarchaeota archaeon]
MTAEGKVYLIGLSKAGKTSIYKRFFLKAPINEIEKLVPTMLYTVNAPKVTYIEEEITLLDLGGQAKFREQYLKDPSLFRDIRTAIFVVDVTQPERIDEVEEYFQAIIEVINLATEKIPVIGVLLHKYDPDKKKTLQSNLGIFITRLYPILHSIGGVFHLTSIYDDSVIDAMVNILFLSLPDKVFERTLSVSELNTLIKRILKEADEENKSGQELYRFAIPFGNAIGKKFREKWIIDDKKGETAIDSSVNSSGIKILKKGNEFKVLITYRVTSEKQKDYSLITEGLIKGVSEVLGLHSVIKLEKQDEGPDFERIVFALS